MDWRNDEDDPASRNSLQTLQQSSSIRQPSPQPMQPLPADPADTRNQEIGSGLGSSSCMVIPGTSPQEVNKAPQVASNTELQKYALQQLTQHVFKTLYIPERQQLIINKFRSSPQLMAKFINKQQSANLLHVFEAFPEVPGSQRQAFQQLVHHIKTPRTPNRLQRIQEILKGNPLLWASLAKSRLVQQRRKLHSRQQNHGVRQTSPQKPGGFGLGHGSHIVARKLPAGIHQPPTVTDAPPVSGLQKHSVQQLVNILRASKPSEILQVLVSNPELMEAIVEQKKVLMNLIALAQQQNEGIGQPLPQQLVQVSKPGFGPDDQTVSPKNVQEEVDLSALVAIAPENAPSSEPQEDILLQLLRALRLQ